VTDNIVVRKSEVAGCIDPGHRWTQHIYRLLYHIRRTELERKMDFISLATEGDPRRLLRHLEQMLGDDDQYDPTNTGSPASTIYTSMKGEEAMTGQSPLLSKTSEAELYLLATNFLLYVAMVIITTMVAKIYFPESLERDTSELRARSYSYRVSAPGPETDDFYGSDVDEDEDDPDGDGEDGKELLDSDDETDQGQKSSNFLEFSQESMTKAQVLRRLVFCALMLNLTFVVWGALQVCVSHMRLLSWFVVTSLCAHTPCHAALARNAC
jgi:hypothetical protein